MPTGEPNEPYPPNTVNTAEAAEEIGCTIRELLNWCSEGVFGSEFQNVGSGNPHRWTPDDIRVAKGVVAVAIVVRALTWKTAGSMSLYREVAEFKRERPHIQDAFILINEDGEAKVSPTPRSKLSYVRVLF